MKLGILGGGQLARMIALAAYPLNVRCVFLDPAADACAASLGHLIRAGYDDPKGWEKLAAEADCVTFEFENVPAAALESLSHLIDVFPPVKALLTSQDRLIEKNTFRELGIETAPFAAVDSLQDLDQAVLSIGMPGILKTRRLGYDGKGQAVIREPKDLASAWQAIGKVPATYEGFVPFEREVSVIAVRSRSGDTRLYPIVENVHRGGILHLSTVQLNDPVQKQAEQMVRKLIEELDYVGVLVLELFQVGERLLANEFAPRVHNSGHWTIEGAYTSQFENHLRAVAGMPLGDTGAVCPSAMINLVGTLPDTNELLNVPGAHLHLYDKAPRAGRKIGHVTVCANDAVELKNRVAAVSAIVERR